MIDTLINVIIPVYNAFDATLDCVQSVLIHTPNTIKILVIDDCSSGGIFSEYFKANFLNKGNLMPANLRLLRNDKNLGFVGTCNRGMLIESGSEDIILLNSDTVVTNNWVSKLHRAAYSSDDVATVTPLTNNGTICSIPKFISDNELPDFLTLNEYAALVENVSARIYPSIPTCVGFCTYIKREVLNRVGFFDPAFSKGYGEENDLSLRCQKSGYKDILDDSTFIHHKGSLSFGDLKDQLSKDNTQIINERYPDYFSNVSKFCLENPLSEIQARIQNALVNKYEELHKCRVLHIIHNGPYDAHNHDLGGTESHVREIIEGLPECTHWSLAIKLDPNKNHYVLSAHLPQFTKTILIQADPDWLKNIIDYKFFETIHIHHTLNFDKSELSELCSNHPNVIYSVHDFYSLCPLIFMKTRKNNICSGVECIEECGFTENEITSYRKENQGLINSARKIITFAESGREILKKIYGENLPIEIIPHGLSTANSKHSHKSHYFDTHPDKPVRIGFLSPLVLHKGGDLIVNASKLSKLPNGKPVEWHIWGDVNENKMPENSNLIFHGRYNRETLSDVLHDAGIDLITIPSLCVETFSYTLSEAWNAGLPVIVSPYGALKERVIKSGAGWILNDHSLNSFLNLLVEIFNPDNQDYIHKQQLASKLSILNIIDELQSYKPLYNFEISSQRRSLLSYLQSDLCQTFTFDDEVIQEKSLSTQLKHFIVESSHW